MAARKKGTAEVPNKPAIALSELPPELQAALRKRGVRTPRKITFNKNDVRTYALRCLASLADLSPGERGRVLTHAAKVNRV